MAQFPPPPQNPAVTLQFQAPAASSGMAGGIIDTTAVSASPTTFWPSYKIGGGSAVLGNPVVHRENRLLVGEFSSKTTGCHDSGAQSWLQTFFGTTCESGQIAVTSTLGTDAITAAVRTSDYGIWHGYSNNAPNSEAVNAFALCDDTNSYTGSPSAKYALCESFNAVTIVVSGANSIGLGTQLDLSNGDVSVTQTPYSTIGVVNTTYDILLTSGGYSQATKNNTAALVVAAGDNLGASGPFWNTGIMFTSNAVAVGAGPSINGAATTVAIGMAEVQAIVWYNSDGNANGAIYGGTAHKINISSRDDINLNANGGSNNININAGGSGGVIINGFPGVTCAAVGGGSTKVVNGIVTQC
jgi:hypothetical protein